MLGQSAWRRGPSFSRLMATAALQGYPNAGQHYGPQWPIFRAHLGAICSRHHKKGQQGGVAAGISPDLASSTYRPLDTWAWSAMPDMTLHASRSLLSVAAAYYENVPPSNIVPKGTKAVDVRLKVMLVMVVEPPGTEVQATFGNVNVTVLFAGTAVPCRS